MAKGNVLVVDDETVICEAGAEILSRAGYTVTTASGALEGLERLKEEPFDLLITDIKMPGVDGMALIQRVRAEISSELPIVVITGHGTIDTAIESMHLGTQGFIMKPFTPREFIGSVENALSKSRLLKENIRLKALLPLFEVSRRLSGELNIERLMEDIIEESVKYTGAERASIMLASDTGENLVLKASIGIDLEGDEEVKVRMGDGIAGMVATMMTPLLLNEGARIDPEIFEMMKKREIRSALSVPIIIKGSLLGVLNLAKVQTGLPFTDSDMEMVSILCGQAGIAIENARLYERLEKSYIDIIAALASTIEMRDPSTAGHAMRMAEYSRSIALDLQMAGHEVETIYRAAILHDVGKIGIADNILLKMAPLTDGEYEKMKGHPEMGVKILEGIDGFEEVKTIIRHHHEHYNGTGYPQQLKGEGIPLGARIVAVADAFEAMTATTRPYRMALPHTDAIEELKKMSGVQFDPSVVSAFIRVLGRRGVVSSDGQYVRN